MIAARRQLARDFGNLRLSSATVRHPSDGRRDAEGPGRPIQRPLTFRCYASAMRLMIFLFAVVFLIIVDQAWFGGHYTSMLARLLRQWV
jgi:hypothetical protein